MISYYLQLLLNVYLVYVLFWLVIIGPPVWFLAKFNLLPPPPPDDDNEETR